MGAWGYSSLESDEGAEVRERWSGWRKAGYNEAQLIDLFLKSWGDAVKYGDSITNNEIIATAQLCLDGSVSIPAKFKKVIVDAINRELEPMELERWETSEAREKFFIGLLDKLGGKRQTPRKIKLFSNPALTFRSTAEGKTRLFRSFRKMKSSKHPISLSKSGFPVFLSTLDRFMNHRIWEKDANIYLEAKKQRLMMLATYLALNTDMSEQEFDALLHRIEAKY